MIVAQYLADHAAGMLGAQPEVAHPDWRMFNAGGVECEVGEFLYGLVRVVKPERILETGTHLGISAAFMGLALQQNGRGKLTTVEIDQMASTQAQTMLTAVGLIGAGYVECAVADARGWNPGPDTYDMILLDTELPQRFPDWVRLWPSLKPGGMLLVHDLHIHMHQTGRDHQGVLNGPYGMLPDKIVGLIRSYDLQSVHFRTPRGLYLAQKAAPDFHSTKVLRGQA